MLFKHPFVQFVIRVLLVGAGAGLGYGAEDIVNVPGLGPDETAGLGLLFGVLGAYALSKVRRS